MKTTKRISACLVSGMLALTLCVYGCGAAVETMSEEQKTEQADTQEMTEAPNYLTNEEQAIFDAQKAQEVADKFSDFEKVE